MTAIAWQYIPGGFTIGADGRRRNDEGGIETESAQKVYGVRLPSLRLAFAWSGTTSAQRTDGVWFTLKDLTDFVLLSLDVSAVASFSEFMTAFRDSLYVLLLAYIGKAVRSFETREIARAVFLAYFNGSPYVGEVTLNHDGSVVSVPQIWHSAPDFRFYVFSGSKFVYAKLKDKLSVEPKSLSEASALIRWYIEESGKYPDIDPDCANIGGHIHIGSLTPSGFTWTDPPRLI
jgi:hypothetical protein